MGDNMQKFPGVVNAVSGSLDPVSRIHLECRDVEFSCAEEYLNPLLEDIKNNIVLAQEKKGEVVKYLNVVLRAFRRGREVLDFKNEYTPLDKNFRLIEEINRSIYAYNTGICAFNKGSKCMYKLSEEEKASCGMPPELPYIEIDSEWGRYKETLDKIESKELEHEHGIKEFREGIRRFLDKK
jgi:hypothetical protein